MDYLRKNKLQAIYITTITLIVVFAISYIYNNALVVHGIDINSLFFIRENNHISDISFLKKYNNLRVYANTENKEEVCVYDPNCYWYVNSSKIISNGSYRYFSKEDYRLGKNVSISIFDINRLMYLRKNPSWIKKFKNIENKYNTEIIHFFDPTSDICGKGNGIDIVRNLFSVDLNKLTKVKIIPDKYFSNIEKKELISGMTNAGFKNYKIKDITILNALKESLKSRIYVKMFALTLICAFFNFLIFMFISTRNIDKEIYILKFSGADNKYSILCVLKEYLLPAIFLSIIVSLIGHMYLNIIIENGFRFLDLLKVESFLVFTILIVYITRLYVAIKNERIGLL